MMIRLLLISLFLLCANVSYSQELLIAVEDGQTFKKGDVVHAMTKHGNKKVHAQHECNVRNFGYKLDGRRESQTLLEDYAENMSLYKNQRINETQIRQTNLDTLQETIIGEPEMYVQRLIDRMMESPRHQVFGNVGSEYWYTGHRNRPEQIDKVWDKIEAKTTKKRKDYEEFPFTEKEKKKYLIIGVSEDLTYEEANEYEQPDEIDTTEMVDGIYEVGIRKKLKERKYKVDFENDLGFTQEEIDDIKSKTKDNDKRKTKKVLKSLIKLK